MLENLYINAEKVIVNLLKHEEKKYLDLAEIHDLCSYIEKQLKTQKYMNRYSKAYFDVNFDSIERTVEYHQHVFALVGDRIYLKQSMPNDYQINYGMDSVSNEILVSFMAERYSDTSALI